MAAFHRHLATLDISNCTTYSEGFPGGLECCRATGYKHCSQDKHIPKLYSTANNMNPRVVPPQLQVCEQVCMLMFFTFIARFLHVIDYVFHYPIGTIANGGDACLCYHAGNVNLPTTSQQCSYKGHIINLPQDVISFAFHQSSKAAIQVRCPGCEEISGSIPS